MCSKDQVNAKVMLCDLEISEKHIFLLYHLMHICPANVVRGLMEF